VSRVDEAIDELYQRPLAEFTQARNALAKTFGGDDAKRVRALEKPTVVPWAVNQVYWRSRDTYDRVMDTGERLRKAQIATLEGKRADVRAANEAHRAAIREAVAEAERLSAESGSKPSPDALTRTFEALSLATGRPERPGRLTEAMQPAGFEALSGISPVAGHKAHGASHIPSHKPEITSHKSVGAGHKTSAAHEKGADRERARAEAEAARRAEAEAREAAEAARQHEAELRKADAALARAEAAEKLARASWEHAHDALLEARRRRDALKTKPRG
jgi:hypothetical protein